MSESLRNQARESKWIHDVRAFCQRQGWTSLAMENPPRLLVEWPVNGKSMLVQVASYEGWALMLLVPLGNVPEEIRQATLLATGILNYRLPVACLEMEPLQGEVRARVTLTPEGELSEHLLKRAFQALEEAITGFVMGVEAFRTLQKAAEALERSPMTREAEAEALLWNSRPATD
jgi:hypothetical protein